MYIGSVPSFVEFGGQTSKNVHDFRKMCLEMTLWVEEYFIEFYVFVVGEILVIGVKLIEYHV